MEGKSSVIYTDLLPNGITLEVGNKILIGTSKNEQQKKESA